MVDSDTSSLLTYDLVTTLLRAPGIFVTAEQKRSWSRRWPSVLRHHFPGSVLDQLQDSVLMRTYDACSGSLPDDGNHRMLARAPRMRLDKEITRKETLNTHADHGDWTDTPYISFTKSPTALQELADYRGTRNRGNQEIVVVDPRTRFELGLPILNYSEEMAYYDVETRYTRDYWKDHYLCLWEVTPEEVVGVWDWDTLRVDDNWYMEHILPAVQQYRQRRAQDSPDRALHQLIDRISQATSDTSDSSEEDISSSDSDDSYDEICVNNSTEGIVQAYASLELN